MQINPLEFSERCEFGYMQAKPNGVNGNKKETFVPAFKRWFGWRNQTFNQQYQLLGKTNTETRQIAVRHDKKINTDMRVRIDGVIYYFVLFSPDNRTMRETVDLLTLSKVQKP